MRRLLNWFRRESLERGLDRELEYHVTRRVTDLVRSGLPEREARRQAMLEVGGITQTGEQDRDVWLTRWLRDFSYDLRFSARSFRRSPSFTITAVLSLALGIGANTAIFTVLNGSVLRPLAYHDPAGLMVVWETRADNPKRAVAPANFLDWRRETSAFSGLAAFDNFVATLTGAGEAQRINAVSASANFFAVLGVQAQIGRVMTADDDRADAPRVAVLTDGLWHQLYGGSADAVGKTMILNGMPHTIVGVLPRSFDMQMVAGGEVWMTGDRGIPRSFPFNGDITEVRDAHIIAVVGRLVPGATREQAQAQLTSVMRSLSERYPSTNAGLGASVVPLHEEIVGDVRPLILLLQIAVAVLLLIACANVAHLLLGQAATRQAEIAMRYALGADRSRIIRQFLIESALLAVAGGAAGIVISYWTSGMLRFFVPPTPFPVNFTAMLSPMVLAFSVATTFATALIFGLLPAIKASRPNLVERSFAEVTAKRIRSGSLRRVPDLERAIRDDLEKHNRDPRPFAWTTDADLILGRIERACERIADSGH